LKNESNDICYHTVRVSITMGESYAANIRTVENPADLATKIMANEATTCSEQDTD